MPVPLKVIDARAPFVLVKHRVTVGVRRRRRSYTSCRCTMIAGSFCSTRVCAKIEEELNASCDEEKNRKTQDTNHRCDPYCGAEAIGIRALGVEQAIFQSVLFIIAKYVRIDQVSEVINNRGVIDPIVEKIEREVASWGGVSVSPHRYGGIEFRVGRRELGHLHGSRLGGSPVSDRGSNAACSERPS